ncbi:type II secretion system F family protein [Patescibacteria group bacterium]|nr:type II secretion system F family protein [Patescibacteria group bacterium]
MRFTYEARTETGESRTGVVEAVNLPSAIDVLQRNNLIIVEVKPEEEGGFFGKRLRLFDRVKLRDVVIFSRQLSTLFEAKVPATQALKTLAAEAPSQVFREAISDILDDLTAGSQLSQAMAKHPNIFSPFYTNLVRSGEESGKLQDVFVFLADYLERTYALNSKAKNALVYPAFVFTAFIGVIVVMLVVVVPKLTSIFKETGQAIPFYTQAIISLSEFLQNWGILFAIALLAAAVAIWRFIKTDQGRELLDELKIRLPVIGTLFKKIYLSRIADNLSTLVLAGVPIIRSLQITADVVNNRVYRSIILDAAEAVKTGSTISSAFAKYKEISPLLTQMIRIGEESGRLDFILKSVSHFYKQDIDNALENMVGLIEPALIIFLGGGVGILVAALLVPLYNLSSAI